MLYSEISSNQARNSVSGGAHISVPSSHRYSRVSSVHRSGSVPVSPSLPLKSSLLRFDSAARSAGSEPMRLLLARFSSVIRPSSSAVMPYHSSSGASLFQFVRSYHSRPFVLLKSANRAVSVLRSPSSHAGTLLDGMVRSQAWNSASGGAHNCVPSNNSSRRSRSINPRGNGPLKKPLLLRFSVLRRERPAS